MERINTFPTTNLIDASDGAQIGEDENLEAHPVDNYIGRNEKLRRFFLVHNGKAYKLHGGWPKSTMLAFFMPVVTALLLFSLTARS